MRKHPDTEQNQADEEDRRTIAPMNVEGMPWYAPKEPTPKNPNAEPLTKKDLRRYSLYAVLAGLSVTVVFGLLGAAFIWFCANVWFR